MYYSIACKIQKFTRWAFSSVIVLFLIALAANVLVVQKKDISNTILIFLLNMTVEFLAPQFNRVLIFCILGLLIVLECSVEVIIWRKNHTSDQRTLRWYLHFVIKNYEHTNSTGFFQPSHAFLSVSVPLDDIFIHLHAVADRPFHDVPRKRQQDLEELNTNEMLNTFQKEEYIQRLRVGWYSELQDDSTETMVAHFVKTSKGTEIRATVLLFLLLSFNGQYVNDSMSQCGSSSRFWK